MFGRPAGGQGIPPQDEEDRGRIIVLYVYQNGTMGEFAGRFFKAGGFKGIVADREEEKMKV